MFLRQTLPFLAISLSLVAAYPGPNKHVHRRQSAGMNTTTTEHSLGIGRMKPRVIGEGRIPTGTQQSPIPLRLDKGVLRYHTLTFNYPDSSDGTFENWGYGPAFTLIQQNNDPTSLPSAHFDEDGVTEIVYLASWHIHAPADHTAQGDRSKAELHLVHANATGSPRSVLAIRIDPGNANSGFFNQLPPMIDFNETEVSTPATLNINPALDEINRFNEFWTYRGSLTSPPCDEGLRWFVARNITFVSDEQMQAILRVSTFSAREAQEVWRHDINVWENSAGV